MDVYLILSQFKKERNFKRIIALIDENQQFLEELILIIEKKESFPFPETASWILTHYAKHNANSIQVFYPKIVDCLFKTKNQTVLRNCINTLRKLNIESYREGELIDLLIHFIKDPKNKIALHVFSIYLLISLTKKHPEIANEIKEIIEFKKGSDSGAIKVANRRFFEFHSELMGNLTK